MTNEDLQTNSSSLFDVVARSDLTALRNILSLEQVDIETRDAAGRTALHLAILTSSTDVCQCLLEHGAIIDSWTEQGEATVHLAAIKGEAKTLLIVMGALEAKQGAVQHHANVSTAVGGKGKHIVDVNCLTRKHNMSPLYIAVTLGKL
jgi:ankyrin repeat protein